MTKGMWMRQAINIEFISEDKEEINKNIDI